MPEKKETYTSIIDAFLDDRQPDWKDLGLEEAKDSGEEQGDRTQQYVDHEFQDDIAESASHHTPVWPTTASAEKKAQRDRLAAARAGSAMANRTAGTLSIGSTIGNRTATQHPEDYKNRIGDDESLFAEVTESLESAASTGKVEKKNVTDAQVQKLVHDLLNQGMEPTKIAARLRKLAEIELYNHQIATRYLQDNAGLLGMAYLEPNTYMNHDHDSYERQGKGKKKGSSGADCLRQFTQWKRAGIEPKAQSVKQISACAGCKFFNKDASTGEKNCSLYHLPVVATTKELSPIVNRMTAGVPKDMKRQALVQIANGLDGTKVATHKNIGKVAAQTQVSRVPVGTVEAQAKRVGRVIATNFDQSHIAALHNAGHPLEKIYSAADNKFGAFVAGKALREFVATFKPNTKGQIILTAGDIKFLTARGLKNKAYTAGAKCASCTKHAAIVPVTGNKMEMISRVPHVAFQESNPDALRTQAAHKASAMDASVVEYYHKKGHSMEKIYKAASAKVGTAVASKAIKDFIASLKHKPIKVALSQIDCSFLKNKLGVHNPIVGASKCGTCVFRQGMHCGLTGGTLLSFPGMDRVAGQHKSHEDSPTDGRQILAEFDLMPNSGRPGDTKMADIDMNPPERHDVVMGSHFEMGDIE